MLVGQKNTQREINFASEDMEGRQVILAMSIIQFEESESEWTIFLQCCLAHIPEINSNVIGITAGSCFLLISCNQLQLGKYSNTFQQHWNFECEHCNFDRKYWNISDGTGAVKEDDGKEAGEEKEGRS